MINFLTPKSNHISNQSPNPLKLLQNHHRFTFSTSPTLQSLHYVVVSGIQTVVGVKDTNNAGMAQYRQSGGSFFDKVGLRNDHVSVGIRAAVAPHNHNYKQSRTSNHRRFRTRRISVLALVLMILTLVFLISSSAFLSIFKDSNDNDENSPDDEFEGDLHFLANVTRTGRFKVLKFGHGSLGHGRDSRYWDKDDRRRDEDYNEELVEHSSIGAQGGSDSEKKLSDENKKRLDHRVSGLYNEAGRNELKMYEAEYEASLKGAAKSRHGAININRLPDGNKNDKRDEEDDADDEYDDEIGMHDIRLEDYSTGLDNGVHLEKSQGVDSSGLLAKGHNTDGEVDEGTHDMSDNASLDPLDSEKVKTNSRRVSVVDDQSLRRSTSDRRIASKKRSKRRKFSGSCEMKILNSTTQLMEPPESPKFSRFSLHYMELEENPNKLEAWEPRFAGHQSLEEREQSFIATDQTVSCGFVKGLKGSPSSGFDLAEDDAKYMSSCHIAVISCIFGNSDRLRSPTSKTVSRLSRKTVCFVMFVDDITLQTLTSDGQKPDRMGYIGLWKIVVVKNLPYTDMRRVGKIPKLLPHRLFPSARYSIWLDSKLRLQLDPLLVLEYFLWRKGFEYAISNHYDRHCVWEEVAQNKKLNKYNHTIIDEQFVFYQADGLKRFNPMDPQKLLPSNVPEGSFIVRAHTPMSNLFSCLWFNEVERFTPRDQLSFAYTYQKLRRMNPNKPFYFNMFKDCERRKIAKLFRHRSEETRYTLGQETE